MRAGVAELVDAPALGAGGRKAVGVQVPPPASGRPGVARTFGCTLVFGEMKMSSNPFTKQVALLVALAAISGPAAALASSGDDQYCDPFSGCGISTSTATTPKPKPGGSGGGGQQAGGSSQGSCGPSTPVSSGAGGSVAGSGAPTGARPVGPAAEKAKRLAERDALTAMYAAAVLDAAGLSPVRMTIAAR